MKHIIKYLCITCLSICLCACSNHSNKEYALDFFHAFDNTLDMNSGQIKGDFTSNAENDSKFLFDIQINQENDLQLACDFDLQAGKNIDDNFLNFFIKDGKTYLNASGTKSQSLVENIGLQKNQRLSVSNPFLSYTDDELQKFFTSASKKDNTYTFKLNPSAIASYLDAFGSISIEDALLRATIENELLKDLSFTLTGIQNIQSEKITIDVRFHCQFKKINELNSVSFPADLESY